MLAGLDARIAIEWGLLDPDKGHQPLSYKTVHKHALILEQLLRTGATLENGTVIDLQWFTYEFLLPSVPKHLRRRVKEIAIDGTAIETYARVFDFTPQKQIKAGRIPKSSIIGPDNKPIRSLDFEATTGYRTKSSRHEAGPYNGYMLHTVTATRTISPYGKPHHVKVGDRLPTHILALEVTTADANPGPVGYNLVQQTARHIPKLAVVKADPGYTRKTASYIRPLRTYGYELIMKHAKTDIATIRTVVVGRHNTVPPSNTAAPSSLSGFPKTSTPHHHT